VSHTKSAKISAGQLLEKKLLRAEWKEMKIMMIMMTIVTMKYSLSSM
jgi:hypothetical protein